jgi:superfamily II DNA or RNA helicase
MQSDRPPLVDAGDIIRLVGPAAFERGRNYARAGRVLEASWSPALNTFSGYVAGNAAHPYRCSVTMASGANGRSRPIQSTCSCPMQQDCKHVAATLLESNADQIAELPATDPSFRERGGPKSTQDRTPQPAWKDAVAAPTNQPAARRSGLAHPTETTPLGLLFELREQTPRTIDRWRGPTARTAKASAPSNGNYRLGVRPVARGKSGKWVRQNLTWGTFPHQLHRHDLDSAQHSWFLQFAALHRSTRLSYYGQDADWLYLDEFLSPLLWVLLEDAARLGIALVAAKDGSVRVGETATVALDLSATPGGDIRLATILNIDGERHLPETAHVVGGHGLYAYRLESDTTITLAPSSLSAEQRRLLGRPAIVTIPAADVPDFMTNYYPRLRRGIELSSEDASVDLPEVLPPTLVLSASYKPKRVLKLDWQWEYDTGRRLPLAADPLDPERDAAAEIEILDRVRALPGVPLQPTTLTDLAAAEFSAGILPTITATEGVRIDVVGEQPDYRELIETPHLKITTMETDRRDWFDLGVVVTVEGRTVPFTPLFKALSKGQKKLLLVDNSYLSLESPVFDQLRELIEEAGTLSEWETAPRISRYQASLWADFEDLADETEQAVAWRAAASGLMDARALPTALPAGLHAELRPYQKDGFDWLTFLWRHGLGGILADDMGLGKTLQALALIEHAIEAGNTAPFLVVAPTSVVSNWVREADRFTPELVVSGVTATEKKSGTPLTVAVRGAHVIVTSYALMRLDFEAYQAIEWAGVAFDEAQFLKNPASRGHECAALLRAPFKLAITGTPLENSLTDLWALFAITAPGLFPSLRRFTEDYVRPVGRGSSASARRDAGGAGVSGARADASADAHAATLIARLRRRIRPLMMRRTKELVASDLPAKQEQELRIDLAPRHRKLYDVTLQRERQKLLGLIEDLDKNRFIVFRSLTLLRMLSLDASLVDDKYADIPSSKLDALEEQLQDVVAEGHRALIFSQFTSFLHKAAERLDALGIEYAYLDGATRRRSTVIDGFKDVAAPVFLISLKAGGFGLNLTEADYVFLLDPWWNPATETQAVDRTHRIGQTKNVMVYRMVAAGTIEEKVMALKAQKAKLFDAIMDDDAVFSSALTADDIRGLLEG